MEHSSRRRNVFLFLSALEAVLKRGGFNARSGALDAAAEVYKKKPIILLINEENIWVTPAF